MSDFEMLHDWMSVNWAEGNAALNRIEAEVERMLAAIKYADDAQALLVAEVERLRLDLDTQTKLKRAAQQERDKGWAEVERLREASEFNQNIRTAAERQRLEWMAKWQDASNRTAYAEVENERLRASLDDAQRSLGEAGGEIERLRAELLAMHARHTTWPIEVCPHAACRAFKGSEA